MSKEKARVIRLLFLAVTAPIIFPVATLLFGYERIAEFFVDLKLSEKWMDLWLWIAGHILPWGDQTERCNESKIIE